MSANIPTTPPEHKGKCCTTKTSINKIGQPTQKPWLKTRMKADDSETVNMSDRSLGKGIRDRGHAMK